MTLMSLTRPRPACPAPVGTKFDADGTARVYAGNTVLHHIRDGAALRALTAAGAELRRADTGGRWAHLPLASYHMTLFDGLIHAEIAPGNRFAAMPDGADPDAWFLGRLRGFDPGEAAPFTVAPAALEAHGSGGLWLRLAPLPGEDARLRRMRDRLADRLGLHRSTHARYPFHISFAYLIDWPTPDEASAMDAALTQMDGVLKTALPAIRLGAPEVCLFQTMHRFDPQFRLGPPSLPGDAP